MYGNTAFGVPKTNRGGSDRGGRRPFHGGGRGGGRGAQGGSQNTNNTNGYRGGFNRGQPRQKHGRYQPNGSASSGNNSANNRQYTPRGRPSFQTQLGQIRHNMATLRNTVEGLDKDAKCNEVRIYGIPIVKERALLDLVGDLIIGVKLSEDVAFSMIRYAKKIDRTSDGAIIVGFGSKYDRDVFWNAKQTNLAAYGNPWVQGGSISVTQNYTKGQKSIADKRDQVVAKLRALNVYTKVVGRGCNIIQTWTNDAKDIAKPYTDFLGQVQIDDNE